MLNLAQKRTRSLISADYVRSLATPLVIGEKGHHVGETSVRLVRQPDGDVEIHVVCKCGEEIVLQCETGGDLG